MALLVFPELPQNFQGVPKEDENVFRPNLGLIKPHFKGLYIEPDDLIDNELNKQFSLFSSKERKKLKLEFNDAPKPWLPNRIVQKLEKMKRTPLNRKEMVNLIEDMAEISANFYQIKRGSFFAAKFSTGKIVESADTEIELLSKIQGKTFGAPIFVWEVGAKSFTGWRT